LTFQFSSLDSKLQEIVAPWHTLATPWSKDFIGGHSSIKCREQNVSLAHSHLLFASAKRILSQIVSVATDLDSDGNPISSLRAYNTREEEVELYFIFATED
jgi:hypothetical protein